MLRVNQRRCLFHATAACLKKSAKPDVKDRKQAYLPYEKGPTQQEIDREHKKFENQKDWYNGYQETIPVKDVPGNMFTYGKEGVTLPIGLLKDQPDPIIAPEHTYPGIFENKIAGRVHKLHELFEREDKQEFESPWMKQKLDNAVNSNIGNINARMGKLKLKYNNRFLKEKGKAATGKGGK